MIPDSPYNFNDVIDFWFSELSPKQWWVKDANLDREIEQRFLAMHTAATQCELLSWRSVPEGRLAEIIVLDQFSRNIFRDSAQAFRWDELALALSQETIALELDQKLNADQRSFLYMPLMHSESRYIHQLAESLFKKNGIESNYEFELKHKVIIDRFGRYPHRNEILGRQSTDEELDFLQQPGSSF
jgi:uncharacterized protein (DUF924 family)